MCTWPSLKFLFKKPFLSIYSSYISTKIQLFSMHFFLICELKYNTYFFLSSSEPKYGYCLFSIVLAF